MSRSKGKPPSTRQRRVNEELRHALTRVMAQVRFDDPVLAEANFTVTEVRASPDLRNATAFVTPLGGEDLAARVKALNKASGYLRHLLAEEIELRYLPRLSFEADASFDEAARIEAILARPRVAADVVADIEAGAASAGPGSEPRDDDGS